MGSFLVHPNNYKKFLIFFFIKYKNEWKEHKFQRQNNQKKVTFTKKKVTKIDDIHVNKILVSKEVPYGILSNTLLDTMIAMLLDHYA